MKKKKTKETCVKTSLASRCDSLIREELENRVQFLSYLRWRADLLFNLYLRWCIENGITPEIECYDKNGTLYQSENKHKEYTQMFFKQLILLGSNKIHITWKTLLEFWNDIGYQYSERNNIPPPSNFEKQYSGQQISFMAQKMQTNFYTMNWRTFHSRQRKTYEDIHSKKVYQGVLWNQIKHDNGHWNGFQLFYEREPKTYTWNENEKQSYEDTSKRGEITQQFLKCNPVVALKAQYDLCKLREKNGLHGFDLAPISTLQRHSHFFDKSCWWEISKRIVKRLGQEEFYEITKHIEEQNTQKKKYDEQIRLTNTRLESFAWNEQVTTIHSAQEKLGEALFTQKFGFVLPKQREHFTKEFVKVMLSTKKNIGGKNAKEFTGGIDTDGVSLTLHDIF